MSQGSVADTGIAVFSRKQYVGHSVLRKWLEEQGSGSRNDFQRNNTELAHKEWPLSDSGSGELKSCPTKCWLLVTPPLCASGNRKLPSEPLAPELCRFWVYTSKTVFCILLWTPTESMSPFPGLLLTLL